MTDKTTIALDDEASKLAAYVGAAVAKLLELGCANGQAIDPTLFGRIGEFANMGGKMRAVIEVEPDVVIRGEMIREIGGGRVERFELFAHTIPGGPDAGEGVH